MLFAPTLLSFLGAAAVASALAADEYHPAAHPVARRKLTGEQSASLASKSKSISKAAASRSKSRASASKSRSLAHSKLKSEMSASQARSRSAASASKSKSIAASKASKSASKASKSSTKAASSASKSASKSSSIKSSAAASSTSTAASTCYKFSALDFTMHDAHSSGTVALCSKFCGANYPYVALLESSSPPAECLCVNAKSKAALGTPVKESLCDATYGSRSGDYVTVVPRKA